MYLELRNFCIRHSFELQLLWASIACMTIEIFENQENQFARKLPFNGTHKNSIQILQKTIIDVLRNALIEAFCMVPINLLVYLLRRGKILSVKIHGKQCLGPIHFPLQFSRCDSELLCAPK